MLVSDNQLMKKMAFIIILVLFCVSAVTAETVLFCISDNRAEDEVSPWLDAVLRAFEDGIMDAFFDAGHIVTNSFLNECKSIAGEGIETNADLARLMANRMGADAVMILEIIFTSDVTDSLLLPVTAEYALYTNTGKTISVETETFLEIDKKKGEEELLYSFTDFGRSIAAELALKLQSF